MAAAKKAASRARRASPKKTSKQTSKKASSKRSAIRKKTGAPKRPAKKLRPAKKDTLIGGGGLRLPHSVSLSTLNPFRLPVSPDQLAIATARYAGAFFVVVGGIFAFYHLQFFSTSLASILEPQVATVCTSYGCPDAVDSSLTVDATPDVHFEVHATEPLRDSVQVSLFVSSAHSVALAAFEKESLKAYTIGTAQKITADEWKVSWDTTQLPDSNYKLHAIIKNEYGEYDQTDSTYYTVQNSTQTSGSSVEESTTTTNESTQTPPALIDLLPEEPLRGDALIHVQVVGAEEVRISLRDRSTGKIYGLGRMAREDTGNWKLPVDTTKYPNGTYKVVAHIKNAVDEYTDSVVTEIQNGSATSTANEKDSTASTTSDTTTKDDTVLVDDGSTAESYEEVIKPEVKLDVRASSPLSGPVGIRIDTKGAAFVELYAVNRYALTEYFLGLATKVEPDRWYYRWSTTNTPNGEYKVFARVKNSYGLYKSDTKLVTVYNPPLSSTSSDDQSTDTESTNVASSETQDTASFERPLLESTSNEKDETQLDTGPIASTTNSTVDDSSLLSDFKTEIDAELQRLATAIRSGDDAAITRVKERLDALRERIVESALSDRSADDLSDELRERIRQQFARLEESTRQTEAMIRERVGEEITRDSDSDGVTDYDEVHLYGTDPQVADSDGDGYIDGAEILSGFDPKDPKAEALVTYESPKKTGVTRSDILNVKEVSAATNTERDQEATGVDATAVIRGSALPNSFVTVYIFSTPVIVTVKTDVDGNWIYRFDKELDDGEHEVYVGVTDNTGRIVAKSEPFRFIKEAQAFTPVDATAAAPVEPASTNNSFATQNIILIVLSLSVVGVGVTLILIGVHLAGRREEEILPAEQAAEGV